MSNRRQAHMKRVRQKANKKAKDAQVATMSAEGAVRDIRAEASKLQRRNEDLEAFVTTHRDDVSSLVSIAEEFHDSMSSRLVVIKSLSDSLNMALKGPEEVKDDFVMGHIQDLTNDNTSLRDTVTNLENENFEMANKVSELILRLSSEPEPPSWLRRIERIVTDEKHGRVDQDTILDVASRALRWAKDYHLLHRGEEHDETGDTEAEGVEAEIEADTTEADQASI